MNNYIKCKYDVEFEDDVLEKVDAEFDKITFLCDTISNKYGDFLIRSNGELCHNIVEYQQVENDQIGEPGVIWNGTTYARITNKEWKRIDYTGELEIKTQIIAHKTDADIKIKFQIKNGYVTDAKSDVLLIDNTSRLNHTEKIKNIAIKRAKRMNTWYYKLYKNLYFCSLKLSLNKRCFIISSVIPFSLSADDDLVLFLVKNDFFYFLFSCNGFFSGFLIAFFDERLFCFGKFCFKLVCFLKKFVNGFGFLFWVFDFG